MKDKRRWNGHGNAETEEDYSEDSTSDIDYFEGNDNEPLDTSDEMSNQNANDCTLACTEHFRR